MTHAQIKKALEDVEFYTPTIPLRWTDYHRIIRQLLKEIQALQEAAGARENHHGEGI